VNTDGTRCGVDKMFVLECVLGRAGGADDDTATSGSDGLSRHGKASSTLTRRRTWSRCRVRTHRCNNSPTAAQPGGLGSRHLLIDGLARSRSGQPVGSVSRPARNSSPARFFSPWPEKCTSSDRPAARRRRRTDLKRITWAARSAESGRHIANVLVRQYRLQSLGVIRRSAERLNPSCRSDRSR